MNYSSEHRMSNNSNTGAQIVCVCVHMLYICPSKKLNKDWTTRAQAYGIFFGLLTDPTARVSCKTVGKNLKETNAPMETL